MQRDANSNRCGVRKEICGRNGISRLSKTEVIEGEV